MKLLIATLLSLSLHAFAEDVGYESEAEIKTKAQPGTIISVQKGTIPVNTDFSITEGNDEIEGDPSPLQSTARDNWKKECAEWKKELKDLNKENQVLSMSCGSAKCAPTGTAQTLCKSNATYKLKVRVTK